MTGLVNTADPDTTQSSCREFAQKHPELASDIAMDGNAGPSPSLRQLAKKCWSGATGAWKDQLEQLIVQPLKYFFVTSPQIQKNLIEACNQSVDCKVQLYHEATGEFASGKALEELKASMSFTKLDVLYRRARARYNSTGQQDRRFIQELENRKWLKQSGFANSDVALDPEQEQISIWQAVKNKIDKSLTHFRCMKPEVASDAVCYGLASVIDPTIAAGIVAKGPRLAKWIVGSAAATDRASLIAALEKKWGRSLTTEERAAIEQAHVVGAGAKGADGAAAGVGNYTMAQLREKYRALQTRFNSSEIRDLMEKGVVGLSKQEQLEVNAVLEKMTAAQVQTEDLKLATIKDSNILNSADYQAYQKNVKALERKQEEIFSEWRADNPASTQKARKEIESVNERANRLKAEGQLWAARAENRNWNVIRENPKAIVPGRIYEVKTERGDVVKVKFNERVVREMMWESADDLRAKAGAASIKALSRGFGGKSGLELMSLDGRKVYKIQIIGRALGAYRIYGVEKNGVYTFVNWEHEGSHDSRYLQRVLDNTYRAAAAD